MDCCCLPVGGMLLLTGWWSMADMGKDTSSWVTATRESWKRWDMELYVVGMTTLDDLDWRGSHVPSVVADVDRRDVVVDHSGATDEVEADLGRRHEDVTEAERKTAVEDVR